MSQAISALSSAFYASPLVPPGSGSASSTSTTLPNGTIVTTLRGQSGDVVSVTTAQNSGSNATPTTVDITA
jgi:hypothetical protein